MSDEALHQSNSFKLTCVAADGQKCTFACHVQVDEVVGGERLRTAWCYTVTEIAGPADQYFEAQFIEVDEDTVLSRMMNRNGHPPFSAKGIPEAILVDAVERLGRRVISSSSKQHLIEETEFRSVQATKVWERLRKQNLACYNDDDDRYEVTLPPRK